MEPTRIVVIISALTEWKVVKAYYQPETIFSTPFGECFETQIGFTWVSFMLGGWGKISASASAEYAITHWSPVGLINLGTCGGFEGDVCKGDILLVEKTIVYDVIERMGDAEQAILDYATQLDLSWLVKEYPINVRRVCLVSADQDLDPQNIPMLREKFQAVAADWESAAIAWVAARHSIPCLILRGVSDVVSCAGSETYGDFDAFIRGTNLVMERLFDSLPGWLNCIGSEIDQR